MVTVAYLLTYTSQCKLSISIIMIKSSKLMTTFTEHSWITRCNPFSSCISQFFLLIDVSFLNIVIIFCSSFLINEFVLERTCQSKYHIYEVTVLKFILRDSHCMSCSLECLWVSWNTNVHLWEKQRECLFWPLWSSRSKESQAFNAQLSAPKSDYDRSVRTTPWTSALF